MDNSELRWLCRTAPTGSGRSTTRATARRRRRCPTRPAARPATARGRRATAARWRRTGRGRGSAARRPRTGTRLGGGCGRACAVACSSSPSRSACWRRSSFSRRGSASGQSSQSLQCPINRVADVANATGLRPQRPPPEVEKIFFQPVSSQVAWRNFCDKKIIKTGRIDIGEK